MLESILGNSAAAVETLTLSNFLVCTAVSLLLGLLSAILYMYKNTYTKSFAITLALLPAIVQIVIMLVNGNLGTGVAVMGAFSLVRFRSVPGSAREIGAIFLAMAIGLATGTGYLLAALLFLLIIGVVTVILTVTPFGESKMALKQLKITIPEDLDYNGIFDDIFTKYTRSAELIKVKTTNLGSLFELCYHVQLKQPVIEKQFIDELRVRNGNLNVTVGRLAANREEL